MTRYKNEQIYSVGVSDELLEYGTVITVASEPSTGGLIHEVVISNRRDEELCLSGIEAVRGLHAVLQDILADVSSRRMNIKPTKWEVEG
jgi:hypothetical protein